MISGYLMSELYSFKDRNSPISVIYIYFKICVLGGGPGEGNWDSIIEDTGPLCY